MRLCRALGLKQKEIVTFVGAGGKTSALVSLARELAAAGCRVIAGPTTKMHAQQLRQLSEPVIDADEKCLIEKVKSKLSEYPLVTCGAAIDHAGKVTGLSITIVSALLSLEVDYLLLEGDGAAGAWLKAPADYEPVIPRETTTVVTVAGLKSLGRPLASPVVHRPQILARILGREEGVPLTAGDLAAAMLHPEGGRKGLKPGMGWVVYLNQAEERGLLTAGRTVAGKILAGGGTRVVLGSAVAAIPVRQVIRSRPAAGPVGVIVLAAGAGKRMGNGKLLLPIAGQPMVRYATVSATAGSFDVVVVTGHEGEGVAAALEDLPVNFAYNPVYHLGMSTSLKTGLAALPPQTQAAVFMLADQPEVSPLVLERLASAYLDHGKEIILPVYRGRRGNPALIARTLWPQVFALEGDKGAREIIARHPEKVLEVEVDCPGILTDVDTPDDYQSRK